MQIEELFAGHRSVATAGFSPGAFNPGLDPIARLDNLMGNPSADFRSIHVAGTNGKGSVCSMLAASLASSGLKVGLYTSPHLLDFRERMKLVSPDGYTMIPEDDVQAFLDAYEAEMQGMTFFEVTTGMAFWWFARQKVDYAVIETGLGGRLDSTNIIRPEVSVISSIGLDHCALLGDTRELIASEKAGIFKSGVPAVVWGHDPGTDGVFFGKAAETACPLIFADSTQVPEDFPPLDLRGPCQQQNLRTVLCTLETLGISPVPEAIAAAAALTGLHGRWEKKKIKTSDGRTITLILDIGHNPDALGINFAALPDRCPIVYGVMSDKDYRSNIRLIPRDARVFLCAPDTPRSLPLADLSAAFAGNAPYLQTEPSGSVAAAVSQAVGSVSDGGTIYIGGSTLVVAEAIQYLENL